MPKIIIMLADVDYNINISLIDIQDLQKYEEHPDFTVVRKINGNRQEELWLHEHFNKLRIENNWFRYVPEMLTARHPAASTPQPPSPAGQSYTIIHKDTTKPERKRAARRAARQLNKALDLSNLLE